MLNFYELRDKIKAYKNRKLRGFVKFLKEKNNLTSNNLSFIGLICGLISTIFLFENNQLFTIFIILAILLDILDGALAKIENKKEEGWIVDRGIDRTLTLIILIKTAFYYNFQNIFPIIALFLLVNLFLIYQRLVLKRNVEILYFDPILYVIFIFGFYKFGLFLLVISYLINFTLLLTQISKRFKDSGANTWANLISILRPFLAIYGLMTFKENPIFLAVWIVVVILLDALDGIIARRLMEESKGGAFIDIVADRAVELIILFTYAHWGMISYIFPIIFAFRGLCTDLLRFLNHVYKDANYEKPLSIGKADNKLMRGFYAAVKLAAFSLILIYPQAGYLLMFIALGTNLYRGLPVIFSRRSSILLRRFYEDLRTKLNGKT